jgi:hypothetical protein
MSKSVLRMLMREEGFERPMKEATRQIIRGIHVLRYPDHSLYVDVAERVRLVHRAGPSFSFERGEVRHIKHIWLYRACITVGEQQYIGDAEIHFGSPIDTPDGTNPISCGQTSAIGNALTFAGFGDLRTLLERLGDPEDDDTIERGPDIQVIQGVDVVLLDDFPYVPVAERLRHLHRTGTSFVIEACEVQEHNGVWIYRATVLVGGKRFIGDAEIFFDASPQSIDGRYPISCGQTSAVGNALAFAGFGDVQSILEREGKSVDDHSLIPRLASADAVVRAKQYAEAHQRKPPPANQRNGSAIALRGAVGADTQPPKRITAPQRERLRLLCERLGESEPATLNEMTEIEAEDLFRRLKSQEEELFQTIEEALQEEQAVAESSTQTTEIASHTEIGTLKTAWMRAYQVKGETSDVRQQWRQFQLRVGHVVMDDGSMTREHYRHLLADIERQTQQEGLGRSGVSTGNTE